MKTKNLRSLTLATALIVIVSACVSQATATAATFDSVAAAREALVADLHRCTLTHGYDPNAAGLPENALAPNELPWRQCAYEAVSSYGKSNPAVTGHYNQLITEDIQMTTALQGQGTMTRTQRRHRIEELVEQIKAAEEMAQIKPSANGKDATETVDAAQQRFQLRNVVDGARGFSN